MIEFERVIFMDNYFICEYRVRVRFRVRVRVRKSHLYGQLLYL